MRSCPRVLIVGIAVLVLRTAPLTGQQLSEHPRVQEATHLLERWLAAQRDYEEFPSIAMAVVHDQEVLWSGGFGWADPVRQIPATSSTMYSICSISKLFTSIAVMTLRDAGEFRLDDSLADVLPWFDIENTFPKGPPVTVRGILTHSAGLPRESDYPYWTGEFNFPTREQVRERLPEQQTLYPAYRYFQYSNLGLTLAGEVVAQTSHGKYADYVRRTILGPLGMQNTVPDIGEIQHDRRLAVGYSALRRSGVREPVAPFAGRGIAPAAGFASTVDDLAGFAAWQFRLLAGDRVEVLNPNTLREMYRVQYVDPGWETTWGLGFSVSRYHDKTFVGHGGSCPGYRSQLLIQPDEQIATIVMVNASGVNTGDYVRAAYDLFAPAIEAATSSPESAAALEPAFEKYLGTYDDFPWGGESEIIAWEGDLGVVSFPTTNPDQVTRLKHMDGDVFRRVRSDDELGEEWRFEIGPDGRVTQVWHFSNPSPRVAR